MSAFTEANRKAFDDLASTYNTKPWQIRISQQVSEALQQRKSWLGAQWTTPEEHEQDQTTTSTPRREVRLLDYACGTGSVTKALGGFVTAIRGIDISENMVAHYNEAARSSGLTQDQAHAVVGDLIGPEVPADDLQGPEFYNFDVAAIGLGFHHFEDPPLAVKRLSERLKADTGVLVIVDFLPFEHNPNAAGAGAASADDQTHNHNHNHGSETQPPATSAQHTIKHAGFTSTGIQRLLASAGLSEDFRFDVLPEPAIFDFPEGRKERKIFIAKARKSPSVWSKLKAWVGGSLDAIGGQVRVEGDEGGDGLPAFRPRRDVP